MTAKPGRTRYELLVERHVSPATLATFPVRLTTTAVPGNRVHRLRIPADVDIADIVQRLNDGRVELIEIRRCAAARDVPPREAAPSSSDATSGEVTVLPAPRPGVLPPSGAQAPPRRHDATVTELVPRRP